MSSFLLAYGYFNSLTEFEATYLLALDPHGTPSKAATKLDGGLGGASIILRGARALIAWSVSHGGFETSDRALSIQIGWFSLDGDAIGQSATLQAPVKDQENTFPYWLDFGDDVALLWSSTASSSPRRASCSICRARTSSDSSRPKPREMETTSSSSRTSLATSTAKAYQGR